MALVQPTNLFPSSFRGSGGDVIDASVENTFSLQLNGASACVAYSMQIMQNDTASTVVYSVEKTTLTTPIYPRDHTNTPQRLSITIPSTSGMMNGYANGYKWNVTLYWNNSDSITSADTFFWAQEDPYFSVNDNPFTLTQKQLALTADYTQWDGVPLEWYRWTLTDENGNVVADTGEIYSEDIQFNVDGLLNGESFTYEITGQTQSGVPVGGIIDATYGMLQDVNGENLYDTNGESLFEVDDGQTHYTNEGEFVVSYDTPSVGGVVTTSCDKKTGAVTVAFPSLRVIQGDITAGTYRYAADTPVGGETSIVINSGNSVSFTQVNGAAMSLPANATHIWAGRPNGNTTVYTFTETSDSGTRTGRLQFSGATITYTYNGQSVLAVSDVVKPSSSWIVAVMYGKHITMQVWNYTSLFPSTSLYPSDTLYPGVGSAWRSVGRFSEDLMDIIVSGTNIGTCKITDTQFSITFTTAGNYQITFVDADGIPVANAISGDRTVGEVVTFDKPSTTAPYYLYVIAYDSSGRFLGVARTVHVNYPPDYNPDYAESASLTGIVVGANQTCNFVKVVSGELPDADMEPYFNINYSDVDVPFDSTTMLFAKFNDSLEAGSYTTGGETIVGWDVYKQAENSTRLQFVGNVDASQAQLTDYLVPNKKQYTYYLFPQGLSVMGVPVISDPVTSVAWNWVLFTATESESNSNVLNIIDSYIFQGNVDSGSISNNASSTVMANFTPYPKIIKGTQNYKSGKLTSLIGYIDTQGNTYTEADGLKEALYALSTSNSRMFLKSRAGDIWEVQVHNAVSMDVADASPYQPHTASIEWSEVGAITGLSVIGEGGV